MKSEVLLYLCDMKTDFNEKVIKTNHYSWHDPENPLFTTIMKEKYITVELSLIGSGNFDLISNEQIRKILLQHCKIITLL